MADRENYRVAIDILCCHLGMSFDEACAELGLAEDDNLTISNITETQQSMIGFLPDKNRL